MIISHKYKTIFIHIPKTGGEAIARFIKKTDPKSIDKAKHATALEVKREVGEKTWNDYYKFAVIRNPWEQAVSFYSHLRKPLYVDKSLLSAQYPEFKESKLLEPKYACEIAMRGPFPIWAQKIYKDIRPPSKLLHYQSTWITDEKGNLIVDNLIKYESLEKGFAEVCEIVGLSKKGLPRRNTSLHKHYSVYYDAGAKEIIGEYFEKDINRFGYQFKKLDIFQEKIYNIKKKIAFLIEIGFRTIFRLKIHE